MFEVSITGWTSDNHGVQLPICQVASSVPIKVARIEYDSYPSGLIDVFVVSKGPYMISRVLWNASRIYILIDSISAILVNAGNSVGVFLYSFSSRLVVNGIRSQNTQGIENLFLRLDDGEVFHVV